MQTESQLKPIETCPKGHRYNTIKYGDTCPVCGSKIANAPKTEDEWKKEIELPPEQWACGMLVCIKGLNKGRGYLIHEAKIILAATQTVIFVFAEMIRYSPAGIW